MQKKIIISGGGTGGHIFPAISIANALKKKDSTIEILFVGAEGKMEMEKVPAAGYQIVGLPIRGLQRKLSLQNLSVPFKLLSSLAKANSIINSFKPAVAVGVGGYASAPLLFAASLKGVPCVIQEQNSYAGVTNKLLSKRVQKICVAYDGMSRFFPKEKIIMTGNPVRSDILDLENKKNESLQYFGLEKNKKVVLILGGSLGARTLNTSMKNALESFAKHPEIQALWQSGKYYFESMKAEVDKMQLPNIKLFDFISRMDFAYSAADLVISRAGAGTISELCIVAKPSILVPSPNVSEDHQTKNAMALVEKNAAILVKDAEAGEKLFSQTFDLLLDTNRMKELSLNISKLAISDSAERIADEILKLC